MRVLVMLPTYNEIENIQDVLERTRVALPDADILVIDDGSPDGTGDVVAALAVDDDRIHLLRRAGKSGLGAAYVAAMRWGIERGYDVLVEMDADGSHPPETLPDMLAALEVPAPGSGRPGRGTGPPVPAGASPAGRAVVCGCGPARR